MTKSETRDEKFKRQTQEQFEALGRFVQDFELMVEAVRFGGAGLLSAGRLANIVFHHSALTAAPLFEIFRAMVIEALAESDRDVPAREQDVANAVLTSIADQYNHLVARRNELLHGTWHIGWASPDQEDFSKIPAMKLKVTKAGLRSVDMPRDIDELRALSSQCKRLNKMIYAVYFCVLHGENAFSRKFQKDGSDWNLAEC